MRKNLYPLFPLLCIALFVLLYIKAASLYPGGSRADIQQPGFDWIHNFWCELMADEARNGLPNPSRPWALTAWGILCVGMMGFWDQAGSFFRKKNTSAVYIQRAGVPGMAVLFFLFTSWHDWVIHLTGILSIISLVLIFKTLYQQKWYFYLYFGGFCLFLSFVNYLIYETLIGMSFLPLLQKITMLAALGWIIMLSTKIGKLEKRY